MFVDWRERGGGLCVYGIVWEQREGWWFGPGDCKSLWPALTSSGWQRCLSPRHSSTCLSRPPYWSHIGRSLFQTPPPQETFLLFHSLFQLHFQVSYFHFLTFQENDKEKECIVVILSFFFLFPFNFSTSSSFIFPFL